jgi:hypothetical protein
MNDCHGHTSLTDAAAETSSIPRTPHAKISHAGVIVPEICRAAENGFDPSHPFQPSPAKNRDHDVERCNGCDRLASSETFGPENVNLNWLGHEGEFASSRGLGNGAKLKISAPSYRTLRSTKFPFGKSFDDMGANSGKVSTPYPEVKPNIRVCCACVPCTSPSECLQWSRIR